jgi:hypothetical protein
MEYIDIQNLNNNLSKIKAEYQSKKPFRYVVFENFFLPNKVEEIYQSYPVIDEGKWDGTTYLDQKNKFQKTKFDENSIFDNVFKELNSDIFTNWLQDVTELEDKIIPDSKLFGGGLHQSIKGAYLNVHIDYNFHPETKYHRRCNVLVYMNKDWKDEYEGHLELWDFTNNQKKLLQKVSPTFNRCVIFETNEISYHGHPKQLNTPDGINRKSLATYYYTKTRPENELAKEHTTVSVNTEGVKGEVKRFRSGIRAFFERMLQKK